MLRLLGVGILLCALALAASAASPARVHVAVSRVVDGDTLVLTTGRRVRLVQIDAPELSSRECYAAAARNALASLLPAGTPVLLEHDARLDRVDRYGRLLAYVRAGQTNVNLALVSRGAASVWFYEGVRGKYASSLLSAARKARATGRGLWKACPGTRLDPLRAVETGTPAAGGGCDPSYPDACIAPPPPDLDCADVGRKVRVRPPDPHRLDGDGDGWGCESYG